MHWFGADPGGKNCFGIAHLCDNGEFHASCVSSADEAMHWLKSRNVSPSGLGVDCPLWWSSSGSGDRQADRWLRQIYKTSSVLTTNSLQGAVLIQGVMLAYRAQQSFGEINLTETHPKVLGRALKLDENWDNTANRFKLIGPKPLREHQRDAILSAVAAREGFSGRWTHDLAMERTQAELDPARMWFGKVHYWWPE